MASDRIAGYVERTPGAKRCHAPEPAKAPTSKPAHASKPAPAALPSLGRARARRTK